MNGSRPTFTREQALRTRRSVTRDGRLVADLEEVTKADGRAMLVGSIAVDRPPYKTGMIRMQGGSWSAGGLGMNGDDDLVDEPDPTRIPGAEA